jgi:response regulator RpfG family c-di-GMP phosphodiesterase
MNEPLSLGNARHTYNKGMGRPWKILIVDDEKDVHTVTRLALKRFDFEGRGLEFIHSYSAEEAMHVVETTPDIAMILLDVVMESEHAGLELVRYIREEVGNTAVRIVLRTGQPGQAPEQQVIRDYDINDYKNKTELTTSKLSTLVYAGLRAYRDIVTLQKSKKGLEKLIRASRGISSRQELNSFVNVTLRQLIALLNLDDTAVFSCETSAFRLKETQLEMISSTHALGVVEHIELERMPEKKQGVVTEAVHRRENVFRDNQLVMYCSSKSITLLFYAEVEHPLSELDTQLLDIFTENLIVILENIQLNELIDDSQREMIYRLGEVVESRSHETGFHVKRVAYYSDLLARLIGLSNEESILIKYASPLHDIGKIGIPDAILNKPGKLDPGEWEVMKTHAMRGHEILKGSGLVLMDIGAIIALTHHEKWDGSGYPAEQSQDDIHIYGRITALADVFDALGSDRCYKRAWPLNEVLEYIQGQSGSQFDPQLVSLMMENLEQFLEIRERFSESSTVARSASR